MVILSSMFLLLDFVDTETVSNMYLLLPVLHFYNHVYNRCFNTFLTFNGGDMINIHDLSSCLKRLCFTSSF